MGIDPSCHVQTNQLRNLSNFKPITHQKGIHCTMNQLPVINLYNYDNYREFLRDFYESEKQKLSQVVTFRSLSQIAGFKSPNFIHLLIHGKRNLGTEGVRKLIRMLGLNQKQANFLENLVFFNQAKSQEDRAHYGKNLSALRQKSSTKLIDKKQVCLFDRWYYTVIRELVATENFMADPDWIVKKLERKISVAEAREAMDFLVKRGFIKQDVFGNWIACDPQIKTRDRGVENAIRNFHSKMIGWALTSLTESPNKRHITGMTLSVSAANFYLIIKKIILFQEEIRQLLSGKISENTLQQICQELNLSREEALKVKHVAQLNTQFFRFTV